MSKSNNHNNQNDDYEDDDDDIEVDDHSSEKPSLQINFIEDSPPKVHVTASLRSDGDGDYHDDDDDDKCESDKGVDVTWPLGSLTKISTVSLNTLLPLWR